MPRGVYRTTKNTGHGRVWPDDVLETLRQELDGGASYKELLATMRAKHPTFHATRNSLIGKAHRLGLRSTNKMKNEKAINAMREARKRDARLNPKPPRVRVKKPKVEKPVELLRDNSAPQVYRRQGDWKRYRSPEHIANARKGYIPPVVESAPDTSKPFSDLKRGECRWPTAMDASMACGGKATCGAYCDKHGLIAYRTMPTRKRHALMGKEQDIDRARRQLIDAEAEATIAHFLEGPPITGIAHVDSFIREEILDDDD